MADTSITEKVEQYIQSRMDGIKWEFEQLRDLASGKQTFAQYLQNYANAYKSFLMQSETFRNIVEQSQEAKDKMKGEWEKAKQDFWKNMEKNYPDIRDNYHRHLKENEMRHKYDMSAAMSIDINGHKGYIGVREKPSFWKRVQNVLSGKKSPYAAVRDNSRVVRKADALFKATLDNAGKGHSREDLNALRKQITAMRTSNGAQKPEQMQIHNNVYEAVKAYCIIEANSANGFGGVSVNGMDIDQCTDIIKNASPKDLQSAISSFKADSVKSSNTNSGINKSILAGVENLEQRYMPQRSEPNKYSALDDGQFRVALGTAYENLHRLNGHINPTNYESDKKYVLDEIKLVMEEAKRRYPNAGDMPEKGSFYKDADVQSVEQQMMPYMREAAKQNRTFAEDVNRFEAWRNGEDAVIMSNGPLKVTERPFENTARWPSQMSSFEQLKNPYQAGSNVMSQRELMQQRELVAAVKVR